MGRPSLSAEEKQYLFENYQTKNATELAKYMGRAKATILVFLKQNNIYYDHKSLSPIEQEFIKNHYKLSKIDWIAKKLDKTRRSIIHYAKKYNLYESKSPSGNLLPLLSDTLESFYWLGFIAADGCVTKSGLLTVSQHSKDKDRVYQLSLYLNSKVKRLTTKNTFTGKSNHCYITNVYQKQVTDIIREKFGLDNICKTHAGIKLDFIKNEQQAISFVLGFMDGDANIRKDSARIQCYHTWVEVFKNLQLLLPIEYRLGWIKLVYKKQRNSSYATWQMYSGCIRQLKRFAIENNIPISPRKWGCVDITKLNCSTTF